MPTTTVTINGTLLGGVTGSDTLAQTTITNTGAIEYTQQILLVSGANTIPIPTGAKGLYMIPPAGNTQTLTIKGITGDTGLAISPTAPFVVGFASSPPANFVVTAGGNLTNNTAFIWI